MTSAKQVVPKQDALGVLMPGFTGTTLPGWLGALLHDGLAGVCLFGHNVETPEQVAALTEAIYATNPLAIISIDEEGGDVSRLHQREGSPFPGNAVLGRLDDLDITRRVAGSVGAELANVGINLTLAPDADVNSNRDNPVIGIRSFGADPARVAAHTAAWIEGVQGTGVAACAKHFPGHGDTSADSHYTEPVVSADTSLLARRELIPFLAAIDAGAKAIMTSHIRVPALDPHNVATFSATILGDVLREQLGFDGVVVTDALDMAGASGDRGIPAAAVAAVAAGSDLLCLGSNNSEGEVQAVLEALLEAAGTAELPSERLADAHGRCLGLARSMADQRQARSASSTNVTPEPVIDKADVAASFNLSDHARAVLASNSKPLRWIRIEPEPNVAIGVTPFGPFFDGGASASLVIPTDNREMADDYQADPGVLTVVVGRELHRDADALTAARTIAAGCRAIVVDMGFTDGEPVDIATFGASRLVGEALLELLDATST